MEFDIFGNAFVSEKIKNHSTVEKRYREKYQEILDKATQEMDKWLDDNNLESCMGVIVKKGSIK